MVTSFANYRCQLHAACCISRGRVTGKLALATTSIARLLRSELTTSRAATKSSNISGGEVRIRRALMPYWLSVHEQSRMDGSAGAIHCASDSNETNA